MEGVQTSSSFLTESQMQAFGKDHSALLSQPQPPPSAILYYTQESYFGFQRLVLTGPPNATKAPRHR
jgi:hypothetical protein